MLTTLPLAVLLARLLFRTWTLAVAETSLGYLSRKEAEGIALRRPRSPILIVMARLPEHLHALRFWRLFAETTAAVAGTLFIHSLIGVVWITAVVSTVLMGLVALLLVLPIVASILQFDWIQDGVVPYLPSNAGRQLLALEIADGDLTQLQGGLVMAAWTAVLLAAAAVTTKSRDV